LQPGREFVEMFRSARDTAYSIRDSITDPDFSPVPDLVTSDVPDGGDTVYLCAADEHGNLVSLIQSVAFDFGSGIVAEGTGMLLQPRRESRQSAGAQEAHQAHPHPRNGDSRRAALAPLWIDGRRRPAAAA